MLAYLTPYLLGSVAYFIINLSFDSRHSDHMKTFHSVSVIHFLIFIKENGRKGELQGAEAIAQGTVMASCSQRSHRWYWPLNF